MIAYLDVVAISNCIPMPGHGLVDSQECVSTFQSSYGNLISRVFFFSFMVSLLFAPISTDSGICEVKQFPIIVFDKPSEKRLFALLISEFKKRQSYKWDLPVNHQTGQIMTMLWQRVSKRSLTFFYPFQWLPGFH